MSGRARRLVALLLLLVGSVAVPGWLGAQERPVPVVRDIAVQGNRRIQTAVVLNRVQTRVGQPFSPAALASDSRAIFALGYFEDVQVRVEEFEGGVRVVFAVVERPLLREAVFEGNREVRTEDLRDAARVRTGVLYNPVDVQRAIGAIRQKYEEEGFLGVTITPRTEKTVEDDLRVVFQIEEGRKTYIDRIVIDGNQALSDRQIKGAMATQERFLWVLPFAKVQRKVFEEDADRILALYADHGYIQARVESHEVVPGATTGKVTLRTVITEGEQFRVGTVVVRGNQFLSEEEILGLLRLKPEDVFSRARLRESVRAVLDRYSAVGRARAEVVPRTEVRPEALRVDIAVDITEGGEVYVERINITGNTRSSETVLRRELRVAEGELFTYQKLVRSRQRLFNLGYFEEVNVSVAPGSTPDRMVVNVDVKERATGVFSIGAGYSSVDNLFATIDLTQRNLFGRGQEVSLRFRIGSESRLGLLSFTEPYLFGIPLRAGIDLFDREREFRDFDEQRLGGNLRASYPLTEFTTLGAVYTLEEVEISDVSETASQDLRSQQGEFLNSVLELSLVRDTRDNVFEPTRGSRNLLQVGFAGLGGDTQWYRVIGETVWYVPLRVLGLVWAVRGLAGYADGWGGEQLPIFERFFLGGVNSLRGQRARSIGPKDAAGNVIGGDTELLVSTELLIPIIPRIRIALFFDTGNAYGFGTDFDPTDLRMAAGVGLRFLSPLGPLRLDYGFNLDRQPGEDSGEVNFTVGVPF